MKFNAGKIPRGFVVLRYRKPFGRSRNKRMKYKWEIIYIPINEFERIIRKTLFRKKFLREIIDNVYKELG